MPQQPQHPRGAIFCCVHDSYQLPSPCSLPAAHWCSCVRPTSTCQSQWILVPKNQGEVSSEDGFLLAFQVLLHLKSSVHPLFLYICSFLAKGRGGTLVKQREGRRPGSYDSFCVGLLSSGTDPCSVGAGSQEAAATLSFSTDLQHFLRLVWGAEKGCPKGSSSSKQDCWTCSVEAIALMLEAHGDGQVTSGDWVSPHRSRSSGLPEPQSPCYQ